MKYFLVYHRLLQEHMCPLEWTYLKHELPKMSFFPLCFYVVEESEPVLKNVFAQPKKCRSEVDFLDKLNAYVSYLLDSVMGPDACIHLLAESMGGYHTTR